MNSISVIIWIIVILFIHFVLLKIKSVFYINKDLEKRVKGIMYNPIKKSDNIQQMKKKGDVDTDSTIIQYPMPQHMARQWREQGYPNTYPHKGTYYNTGASENFTVVGNESYPGSGYTEKNHVDLKEMEARLNEFLKVDVDSSPPMIPTTYTHTNSYESLLNQPTYDGIVPFETKRVVLPSGNRTNVGNKPILSSPKAFDSDISMFGGN